MITPETQEIHIHGKPGKVGLVLSGGGARGAYQAGVVKAIATIAKEAKISRPLPILTGVSAGAVNAAFIASKADDLMTAAEELAAMWSKITADQVFRTDVLSASRSGLRLFTDAALGAFYKKKLSRSLLDTSPLSAFLEEKIPFQRIDKNISSGHIDSLAVTATNYMNAMSVTFVHGPPETPMWTRSRRISQPAKIRKEHVMASSAIPLFFPPVKVGNYHFGDGCLRNNAPLSPAIHLGANRLIVVSVRRPDSRAAKADTEVEPSFARILGVILNALLLDSIETDVERMSRVNTTISYVPAKQRSDLVLREIDYIWLRPSQDLGRLAGELFHRLPQVIRYLVSGLGSSRDAAELTSYLLFDPDFCGQLVHMGYQDTMAMRDKIEYFLTGEQG